MDQDHIKTVVEEFQQSLDERRLWEETNRDVTDYMLPRYGKYILAGEKSNDGQTRYDKIFDSSTIRALRIMASGMQGGTADQTRPWFRMALEDPDRNKKQDAKEWLSECDRRMYARLARSNFYSSSHNIFLEMGGFGSGCQICLEDPLTMFWFRQMTYGEYTFLSDARNRINTVFRHYSMTAKQLVEMFGEGKVSQAVKNEYDKGVHAWHEVIHRIGTRKDGEPAENNPMNHKMPFSSLYLEYAGNNSGPDKVLRNSGFLEKPFQTPRWNTIASEVYGRSPGHDALADAKMLQEMVASQIEAIHKEVDPPMIAPAGYGDDISSYPGGISEVDDPHGKAMRKLYDVKLNIQDLSLKIAEIKKDIREGFFYDLFLMLANAGKEMTATEVLERKEEKVLLLGPVIHRHHVEYFDLTIDRVFGIMARTGAFPPPPKDIENQPIKVEYTSLLAQALKAAGVKQLERTVGFVANLAKEQVAAGLHPRAWDKLDDDQAIDEFHDMVGSPPKIIRPDDVVSQIRQQRTKDQAAQAQMQQMMAGLEGAEKASNIRANEAAHA